MVEWIERLRQQTNSTHILTSTHKAPWTSSGFKSSFGKATAKAGIVGLTFHDLRGTVATRDYQAGATVEQIAARYGWSLYEAKSTLERHYLGPSHELGDPGRGS